MNIKVLSFGCIALTASMAQAVDFPKAGGDLASADDWGRTVPGSTEGVSVPKSGDYTLSDNVSFKNLTFKGVENTFDLGTKTLGLVGGFIISGQNSGWTRGTTNLIANGTITLSGEGPEFLPVRAAGKTGNWTVFTNMTLSTEGHFKASTYSNGSKVSIYDSSLKVAKVLAVAYDCAGASYDHMNNVLEVVDSSVEIGSGLYFESNSAGCGHSDSVLIVRGSKASVTHLGEIDTMLSFNGSGDQMIVSDHATVSLQKSSITTGRGESKICVESGASLTAPAYTTSAHGFDNEFRVTSGATAAISKFMFSSSGNTFVIDNATYDMGTSTERLFTLATTVNCSNNVAIIRGAQVKVSLAGNRYSKNLDIFGAGHNNALILEGGAVWAPGSVDVFMQHCTNSTFVVRGAGTEFGTVSNSFYTANKSPGSIANSGNRIEISDGATFKVDGFAIQGVGTEVVVSNATLELDAADGSELGLRVGYKNGEGLPALTANNVLVLRGENPQVKIAATNPNHWRCRVTEGSTLRFEIPETGYSTVPLTSGCTITVDASSNIEIDCADFCEKTGGKVQLMHSAANIPQTTQDALARVSLPEGAQIIVDGGDVYLKSPRRQGLILMVR